MVTENQLIEQKLRFRDKLNSQKFITSLIFAIGGTAGLLLGKMTGDAYGFLAGATLGGLAANKWAERKDQ